MPIVPEPAFDARVARLPFLGTGISTEFGAGRTGVDLVRLHREEPELCTFLELGVDLERGIDADARAWIAEGWPTTYHFLDLNLEEAHDLDPDWIETASGLARSCGAAWMCGDAGLWHIGPRERGHATLMPPILTPASASELAGSVRRLRAASGFEVLPENAPAHVYLGELHILEYFARVADEADCGLLLDVAHLAIFQHVRGLAPTDGFDAYPFERVVELHVAGGRFFEQHGRRFVDDDHGTDVLPATWEILEHVLARATNLRAIVLECERNPRREVEALFRGLRARLAGSHFAGAAR